MVEAITTGVGSVLGWIGQVLTSLTTTTGDLYALLPFIGIAVGIFVVRVSVSIIKSVIQGY